MNISKEAIEAAAVALCNLDEDLAADDPWGARLINNSRDAEHSGDCTKESFTCCRCVYSQETKRAEAALSAALPHLTPKATPSDEERAANLEKYGRYSTKEDSEEMKSVYLRALAAVRAEAALSEREACAKMAENWTDGETMAAAIRGVKP